MEILHQNTQNKAGTRKSTKLQTFEKLFKKRRKLFYNPSQKMLFLFTH
jgi:hypothetical protein